MKIIFRSNDLKELYEHESGPYAKRLPPDVVNAFFLCMAQVDASRDERDLRTFKSRRMEKIPSECEGCYSMRLNDQFRLIFTLETTGGEPTMVVREVKDYH